MAASVPLLPVIPLYLDEELSSVFGFSSETKPIQTLGVHQTGRLLSQTSSDAFTHKSRLMTMFTFEMINETLISALNERKNNVFHVGHLGGPWKSWPPLVTACLPNDKSGPAELRHEQMLSRQFLQFTSEGGRLTSGEHLEFVDLHQIQMKHLF